MKKDKYIEGTKMDQFRHIPEISNYNSNYYLGFDKDLLFAEANDDRETVWHIIDGIDPEIFLGWSYVDKDEKLQLP